MIKKGILILILTLLVLITIPTVFAVISKGYSHSYDYYSVSYDGEGDSIVRAKLTINNDATEDIEELSLEIPGKNIIIYDVFEKANSGKTCLRYKTEPTCVEFDEFYNCERYEDKHVCDYWNVGGPTITRIENLSEEVTTQSTILKIKLSNPIEKDNSGEITLIYKIPRSAKKTLGLFSYEFKTIIDPQAKLVDNVRVAVNVEEGLYLKGTSTKVDYQTDFFGAAQAEVAVSKIAVQPDYYHDFSRQIVQSKGYVKTTSNLDPWESFIVKGKYSKSYFQVHFIGFIFILLLIVGVIYLLILGIKSILKHLYKEKQKSKKRLTHSAALVFITSALSAITLTLLWLFAWFIIRNIRRWIGYRYDDVFVFILLILFALLMLTIFLMPPIFISIKKGIMEGIATLALTIVWLILIVIILGLLLISFWSNPPIIVY